MPQQTFDFRHSHIEKQIITPGHIPESKTTPTSLKLEESDKERYRQFAFSKDISASELFRRGADKYIKQSDYEEKIEKYWDALTAWLDKLP